MTDGIPDVQPRETLNTALDRAVFAYAELTRLREDDWQAHLRVEDLNQSRDLDPAGTTTFMLLRGALDTWKQRTTFSVAQILADPAAFDTTLAHIRAVQATVEHPEAERLAAEFRARLRATAEEVGVVDRAKFDAFLADTDYLAWTRRDALRSMETLAPYQFTVGEPDPSTLRVGRTIFEFWNINSLLAALRAQAIPGVTLCLIRDRDEVMASYFIFAVKSGDCITILTDREKGAHPDYWRMSRRPDRALERRAEKHHFPYQLLDLEQVVDEHGQHKGLRAAERTGLVRYQTEAVALATLGTLPPDQVAWVTTVLELIANRYGGRGAPVRRLPATAYTGEMVVEPEALVGRGGALVRTGLYQPLALAPLTPADVTADGLREQWGEYNRPIGHNEWMIDAYGGAVPAEAYNVVGGEAARRLAEGHRALLEPPKRDEFGLWAHGIQAAVEPLHALPAVDFGTAEELDRDRKWAARMNQTRFVQAEAERVYARDKDEILAWCRSRLDARREWLAEVLTVGVVNLPANLWLPNFQRGLGYGERNALRVGYAGTFHKLDADYFGWTFVFEYSKNPWRLGCLDLPDRPASVYAKIRPMSSGALAGMFGVALDELPLPLQHWYPLEPYRGNSILDRIDPSDWVLRNPWNAVKMQVTYGLSLTAWRKRRKAMGLDPALPESAERKKESRG